MSRAGTALHPDLAWLAEVLWPGAVARVEDSRTAAASYGVIGRKRPRFLIPMDAPRAARASLTAYNKLRPRRVRAARSLAAASLRAGASRLVLAGFLHVDGAKDDIDLGSDLAGLFGRDDVVASIGIPPVGPNRKPVLQVFSRQGDSVGYVKLGWSDITRRRVEAEAEALAAWSERRNATARVPQLIRSGEWRGLQVSATAPLPADVRRWRSLAPPLDALREILELGGRSPVLTGAYLERQLRRAAPYQEHDDLAAAARGAIEHLIERHGDAALDAGIAHGDWVPWNLAVHDEEVYVFDWEHWSRAVPVGLDVLYWHFQVSFVLEGDDVVRSLKRAPGAATDDLAQLGVPVDAAPLLGRLLLVELALRAVEGVAAGAPENPRFHRPAAALLGDRDDSPRGR